jgi:hypothetical protein
MSIAYVTDGVTDLDSALFNPIIDRVNGDAGPLGNMRLGIYNVLDYANGALADGSTDFTPFAQAAIDAAELAGGGTITFPGGSYLMDPISGFGPSSMKVCCYITSDNITIDLAPDAIIVFRDGHANGAAIFNFNGMVKPEGVAAWSDHWVAAPVNVAQYPVYAIDPVAKGDSIITLVTPAHAANFSVGDAVFLRTGQTIENPTEASEPDAELNEIVAIDGPDLHLRWPAGKPYVQEYFPDADEEDRTSTSVTAFPALFGIQNVEAAVVRNVAVQGGIWDIQPSAGLCWATFFVQVIGWKMRDIKGDFVNGSLQSGGTFRTFRMRDIDVTQGNTISESIFIATNTGCSDGLVKDANFVGTSADLISLIHCHEGSANITFDNVNVTNPPNASNSHGVQFQGRWYDIEYRGRVEHDSSGNGLPILASDDGDGMLIDATVLGNASTFAGSNVVIKRLAGLTSGGTGVISTPQVLNQWIYHDSDASTIMGTIPQYAYILQREVQVFTAFNGTTPSLTAGMLGGYGQWFISTIDLDTEGVFSGTPNTVVQYYQQSGADERSVEITLDSGGSTAGRALVVIVWAWVSAGSGI